ncbi:hypothetical protein GE061_003573 [Apolygus lucorum]|uniref:Uncharacterized protein n=1 Tax=Apolygus lucorum TaxID=248454 RepID=A0A8S9X506_APOLU|nr:hypothetical protein GE061_003573 [Apolygus lucorum]
MTRKKSRPQHRENVSPKSANEGGFYKMFWNSMDGDGGTDASGQSPDIQLNSPSVIVINDSDDENPYTIDENSGDNLRTPLPIKKELLLESQTSDGDKDQNEDLSDGNIPTEETIEDGVVSSLQPTLVEQSFTSLCDGSINSLPLVPDQRTASDDQQPTNQVDFPEESCSVSQDHIVNDSALEQIVIDSENATLPCESSVPSESPMEENISSDAQSVQENGCPLNEVGQVSPISSLVHQIEDLSGINHPIPTVNETFVNENRIEEEEMPNDQSENNTCSSQAMSESTGQALELLKSLLILRDEEDPICSTSVNNDHVNMDVAINDDETCVNSVTDDPLLVKGGVTRPQFTENIITDEIEDSTNQPSHFTSPESSVPEASISSNVNLSSEPTITNISEPSIIQKNEPSIISKSSETPTDEFPSYGNFLPSKIKIEPIVIMHSLDLLKKELLAFYNNCNVRIAFEHKTDNIVVDEVVDKSENKEVNMDIPITPPCLVMVERLPTPMVLKGYVALRSERFLKWKRRIIRLRNEEKFRHLGVWRRGGTRLWRECQLAGMDKSSYDRQVEYIARHRVYESSSSDESTSDGELETSTDNISEVFHHSSTLEQQNVDNSSADESDGTELNSDNHTLSSTPDKTHTGNSTNLDHSASTLLKSALTKGKLIPESFDHLVSPCRDEYIVERNTVDENLNSAGKNTAPLKITIRKTSINKSEDEREKSVESEVENSFTVIPKPVGKRVKRTFVTKRTYRKPGESHQTSTSTENSTQSSTILEPPKKRPNPFYVDDNNEDEESLLGRRSHEVENFNLLEKWDIPFEEPTLFRSPRVASRLAQIKTKEAFARKTYATKQPVVPKPVTLCKDVKEVVDMLCSKTVESMLLPDGAIINSPKITDSNKHPKPINSTPEVQDSVEAEEIPPQVETEEVTKMATFEGDDTSETHSATHYETSSTIDTSECGDSPKKVLITSPTTKRRKRPYGYRRKRGGNRAKSNRQILENSSNDEKIDTEVLGTRMIPKVLLSPIQSTQVPVVSEGPGQSPQESEEDFIQLKDIPAGIRKVENKSKIIEKSAENPVEKKDETVPDKPKMVNTRSKQPVQASDGKEIVTPRVTRSKQPTITLDPDVLENFGIRKINRKSSSSDRKNNTSDNKDECKGTPAGQPKKSIQRKKVRGSLPVDSSASVESIDSDLLNTQVHEVSEGPGEVEESNDNLIKQPLQIETPKIDSSATKEIESEKEENSQQSVVGSLLSQTRKAPEDEMDQRLVHSLNSIQSIPDSPLSPTPDAPENEVIQPRITRSKNASQSVSESPTSPTPEAPESEIVLPRITRSRNASQSVPDSPMSPTPDAPENEVVQPRITRSKNRMLRGGTGYITVKPTTNNDDTKSYMNTEDTVVSLQIPVKNQIDTIAISTSEQTQDASEDPDKGRKKEESTSDVDGSSDVDRSVAMKKSKLGSKLNINDSVTESEPDTGTYNPDDGNQIIMEKGNSQPSESVTDSGTEHITNNSIIESELLDTGNSSATTPHDTTEILLAKQIKDTIASLVLDPQNLLPSSTVIPTSTAGGIVTDLQSPIEDISLKKSATKVVSPTFTERSNSPLEANQTRGRREVLDTLNSILKLSSQNKKISDSLTSAKTNDAFEKKEAVIELKNASDDEFDSGDADDGLVVDEDRDFSDDDDNSAELASRIDQIIKDQIKSDHDLPNKKDGAGKENSKDSLGKRRDSIDERTGLPTTFLQKLRDPRIRSKLLSQLEENEDSTTSETVSAQHQSLSQTDSSKAPVSEKLVSTIRDPRARNITDPRRRVETQATATEHTIPVANDKTGIEGESTTAVPRAGSNILRDAVNPYPRAGVNILRDAVNPVAGLRSMVGPSAILSGSGNSAALSRGAPNTPSALGNISPAVVGTLPITPILPRAPLLPTPAVLLPTIAALRHTTPPVHPAPNNVNAGVTQPYVGSGATSTSEFVAPNKSDDVDDDDEESLKRRPKKQKKEVDTELMYRSPLEDLQSESRPTYDRNRTIRNQRYDRRQFSDNKRGRRDSDGTRPSRWDVRHLRQERDNLHYPEIQHPYNQERWSNQQTNGSINPIPTDCQISPIPWKRNNWYPEHSTHTNDMMHQEPQLNYMDAHLLKVSLLPKTTNLNTPPFTKIYASFNHGNPQILGVAPPTFDPKEKASTITMMDPMGQEMIDIVQLPRPTSGLTSDYFNDLPDEFSLEDLVTHPYLELSDMMDEEVEIENHGINIFDDSDEERKIVRAKPVNRRLANDPRNQSSVLVEKFDNNKNVEVKKSLSTDDPLENILHCLPALKEQYAFKKSKPDPNVSDPWDDGDKPVAPPPPTWSNEKEPETKAVSGGTATALETSPSMKNWRNPSPPKKKTSSKSRSPKRRRSRSKSPPRRTRRRSLSKSPTRRRSRSRSWSPGRRKRTRSRSPYSKGRSRSRSPYSKGRSRSRSPYSKGRSRSRSPYSKGSRAPSTKSTSPSYRSRGRSRSRSRSRGRSRSSSLGRARKTKRSRSRSPGYHRSSISPSRKRHSRR